MSAGAPSPQFGPADEAEMIRLLHEAAAEVAGIAEEIQQAAEHATAALGLGTMSRAPLRAFAARRRLLRALTNGDGLGFALTGGRVGASAERLGGMAGRVSLARLVAVTSLRLRLAAVQVRHQELAADPLLRRLVQAVSAGREIETLRIVRALFRDRGSGRTLSDIAPMFGEILAMKALLDTNPLNDTVGWVMATGRGVMNTDPITGISTRAMTHWDTGEGAALPVGLDPGEDAAIANTGSLTAFLSNIQVIGTGGRVLIQAVIGPDDVIRHVIHAPGMHVGLPRDDSPHDLVGAFGNTIRDASPYTRALSKAIEHFGVPPGSEVALVGHSAGGVAIMNLAQDAWFCRRFTVTHAVAVGSPIDFKRPADPRTIVVSITNRHDLIPSLDGQGSGSCFDLHPDWLVVDYADPTHPFPACHSIESYLANLIGDLPEACDRLEALLLHSYRGPVSRSQPYRTFDNEPTGQR